MRGVTVQVVCACGCGAVFTARLADRNRGWGKYASKSCKATHQEAKTGQYREFMRSRSESGQLEYSDFAREMDHLGMRDEDFGHFAGDLA